MKPRLALMGALALFACRAAPARAQSEVLDRIGERLSYARGDLRLQGSGLFDLEGYWIDQRPPGLLFGGDQPLVNPRLWLFVDAQLGSHLSGFVEVRADDGFDPRSDSASARFDEYFVRYTPLDSPLASLQVGKFATLVGNWVERHDSWQNPLIDAPLPYENVTIASDGLVPPSSQAFLDRRNVPDRKDDWLPILWGPVYTTGAAMLGRVGMVGYGVEVKNAPPSSRPELWDGRQRDFDHPTVDGRFSVHPDPAWTVGVSLTHGPYLRDSARADLPPGRHLGDFDQTLVGVDASWSWRRLQLWSEVFLDRFEVPNVEDVDSLAYYVEGKLKLTSSLFAALRWNQQLFEKIDDGAGRKIPWDRDVWRIDTGLGYRLDRHWQCKVQYALARQAGRLQQGEQLAALQLTLKF